jgi:hypothetical protein
MPATGGGAPVHEIPAPVSVVPVTLAGAVPVFARVSVTVKTWPVLTTATEGATETAVTLAGDCTAVDAVVAEAESAVPVPAAVPLALAVNVGVPAPDTVQVKE